MGDVLGRAHALFGQPASSCGVAGLDAGSGLAAAGDLVRTGRRQMSGLSGALPATYTGFATDAGPALDTATEGDLQPLAT
jgi:peptidoglycan DL-endopeptidase CwlO